MTRELKEAIIDFVDATEQFNEENVIGFLNFITGMVRDNPEKISRLFDEKGVKYLTEIKNLNGKNPLDYFGVATKLVNHVKGK